MPFTFDPIGAIINLISNLITNKSNRDMQESTNEANARNVAATNAANAQQAELAYQRNSVGGQLKQLTEAGLSRQGALNAINGAGSYQPAQFDTAQASASRDLPFDISRFTSGLTSSAQQSELLDEQRRRFDEEMQLLKQQDERQAKYDAEKLEEQQLRNAQSKREEEAIRKANDMFSVLSGVIADADIADIRDLNSFVSKRPDLASLDEWKAIKSDTLAYNKLQSLILSNQQTSQGAARDKLVWNDATRIAFRNSIEEIDKAKKLLDNKELRQRISHDAELYPIVKQLESGKLQQLLQTIEYEAKSHPLGLDAQRISNIALQQGIDIKQAQNSLVLAKEKARNTPGVSVAKIDTALIDALELILSPIKGLVSIGL